MSVIRYGNFDVDGFIYDIHQLFPHRRRADALVVLSFPYSLYYSAYLLDGRKPRSKLAEFFHSGPFVRNFA